MKKLLPAILLCSIVTLTVNAQKVNTNAQTTTKIFKKENAFVGGNVTLPVLALLQGQKDVQISLNPHFGYKINKSVDIAAVLNIQSNKFDNTPDNYNNILNTGAVAKINMLGVGVFARVFPIDFIFFQLQPEVNMVTKKETKYSFNTANLSITTTELSKTSKLKPSLLLSAGYKQGFSRGTTFAYASIVYDVITKNSPYSNAIVQTATGSNNSSPIFFRAGFNIMLEDLKRR